MRKFQLHFAHQGEQALWEQLRVMSASAYDAAMEIMTTAASLFDATESSQVHLPLQLDRVPSMLQFALDSHAIERSHVMYQSMERWLLGAFGNNDAEPDGHFDNLLNYSVAQHSLCGAASCHFAHGPGATAGRPCNTPSDYLNSHNSGVSSARTVQRALPANAKQGVQLPLLLNLFEDVKQYSGAVTYSPCEGCVNTLVNVGYDGLSLGKGVMVDGHLMQAIGFEEPIGVDEAARVLAMDDEELQAWTAKHPFLADGLEFIATAADNSISGNLGYIFVSAEGNHADVAKRLVRMLRPLRTCYCCLK